jgi:hypothetical protein
VVPRTIASLLLLSLVLAGCHAPHVRTNTATLVIDGLKRQVPDDCPISIDPSLCPKASKPRSVGFLWDTQQEIEVKPSGPVKLVPWGGDSGPDKVGRRHTATIVVTKPPKTDEFYPILLDPSLVPQHNKTRDAWDSWGYDGDLVQRIVLHSRVPLRLVPASPEEVKNLRRLAIGVESSE